MLTVALFVCEIAAQFTVCTLKLQFQNGHKIHLLSDSDSPCNGCVHEWVHWNASTPPKYHASCTQELFRSTSRTRAHRTLDGTESPNGPLDVPIFHETKRKEKIEPASEGRLKKRGHMKRNKNIGSSGSKVAAMDMETQLYAGFVLDSPCLQSSPTFLVYSLFLPGAFHLQA